MTDVIVAQNVSVNNLVFSRTGFLDVLPVANRLFPLLPVVRRPAVKVTKRTPPPDRYEFDETSGEYAIYVGGECYTYAEDEATAERIYIEALATRRQHHQRCPMDTVL